MARITLSFEQTLIVDFYAGNGFISLIDQDKFMSETWDHWFMSGDNSGDVMVWKNMVEMRSWLKEEMGDIHLVSSVYKTISYNSYFK